MPLKCSLRLLNAVNYSYCLLNFQNDVNACYTIIKYKNVKILQRARTSNAEVSEAWPAFAVSLDWPIQREMRFPWTAFVLSRTEALWTQSKRSFVEV